MMCQSVKFKNHVLDNRISLTWIKVGLAALFLICLLNMPCGYYQFVRFLGMIGFGILAFSAHTKGNSTFMVIWAASAVLINPIIKIPLGRELWNIVDVIWAVGLLVSLKSEKSKSIQE